MYVKNMKKVRIIHENIERKQIIEQKCLFLTLVSLNKRPQFNCIQHMWKNYVSFARKKRRHEKLMLWDFFCKKKKIFYIRISSLITFTELLNNNKNTEQYIKVLFNNIQHRRWLDKNIVYLATNSIFFLAIECQYRKGNKRR